MKISDALKKERKELGLRQKDMFSKLKISKSHYSQIENGFHRIYADDLLRILVNLNIDYHKFFDEVIEDYGFDMEALKLENKLSHAFYNRDLKEAIKVKKEIFLSKNVSFELKYHALLVLSELKEEKIPENVQKDMYRYLFKENWTENKDTLRIFGNAMKYFDEDIRAILMDRILKEYKNISNFSEDVQKRVATICINYLFNYEGELNTQIEKIINLLDLLKPLPQFALYKILVALFKIKFYEDKDTAKIREIKNTLILAGYNQLVQLLDKKSFL